MDAANDQRTVGVIGLGRIGLPIATNLISAGFEVNGYRRGAMDDLERAGGHPRESVTEVAESSDVVITCLPSSESLRGVVADLAATARRGQIVIEMSTFPLEFRSGLADELATVGIDMLDCPVLGLPPMVAKRKAVVFVGGPDDAYQRIRPVLDGFTDIHHHVGDFGAGTKFKFVANTLVALNTVAVAEALALAAAAGLDLTRVVDVLTGSAAGSTMLTFKGPLMIQRTYEPSPGPVGLLLKDLAAIADYATQLGVDLPALRHGLDVLSAAAAQGRGEHDTASIFELITTTNHNDPTEAP